MTSVFNAIDLPLSCIRKEFFYTQNLEGFSGKNSFEQCMTLRGFRFLEGIEMGNINHNAVIATTWNNDCFERMVAWISQLKHENPFDNNNPPEMFMISGRVINGYRTIILIPDGSNEGWKESEVGNNLRDTFIQRLEEDKYEDESSPWDYIEVGYGCFGNTALRSNCKKEVT